MQTSILYIFTRTPLHVGAGSSVGAIDQPVMRERHTGFPIIPGSSLKGVLRDHLGHLDKKVIDQCFGKGSENEDFSAGNISFSEAKLLAMPVRSARGSFAFVTSNLALSRFKRDTGSQLNLPKAQNDNECLAGEKVILDGQAVVLEEYRFKKTDFFPSNWENEIKGFLQDAVLQESPGRWVLLSDGDFSHFAVNSCQISQHVRIDDATGTAEDGGLFNEETVPSETLFYSVLVAKDPKKIDSSIYEALQLEQMVQFGGKATTGLGFCTIKLSK